MRESIAQLGQRTLPGVIDFEEEGNLRLSCSNKVDDSSIPLVRSSHVKREETNPVRGLSRRSIRSTRNIERQDCGSMPRQHPHRNSRPDPLAQQGQRGRDERQAPEVLDSKLAGQVAEPVKPSDECHKRPGNQKKNRQRDPAAPASHLARKFRRCSAHQGRIFNLRQPHRTIRSTIIGR